MLLHLNIRKGEIAEEIAAIARGFDADGLVATVKRAVADQHMLDAAIGLAADGDAVAMQAGAIFDQDVLHGEAGVADDGFDGDVVITLVEDAIADDDAIAGCRVDGIGVGGFGRRLDAHAVDEDILAADGGDMENRGVGECDTFDAQAFGVLDGDEAGLADAPRDGAEFRRDIHRGRGTRLSGGLAGRGELACRGGLGCRSASGAAGRGGFALRDDIAP